MDKPLMFVKSTDTFIVAELHGENEAEVLLHAEKGNEIQLLQLFNAVVQSLMRKGYDQRSIELTFASAIYQANCKNM